MARSLSKTMKRTIRRVRDRNRRFAALDKNEQRVKIAQDVISYLDSKKFVAKTGKYVNFDRKYVKGAEDKQLNIVLESIPKCDVCGIGSMFMAAVGLNDKLLVKKTELINFIEGRSLPVICSGRSDQMRKYLKPWFSTVQLEMIECAFERKDLSSIYNSRDQNKIDDAIAFGRTFRTSDERLRAICQNIIENNGRFVPPRALNSYY